jgi:hypothetical protein
MPQKLRQILLDGRYTPAQRSAAQRITPSGARRSHDAPTLSGLRGRRQPLDRDGSNSRLVRVHALLGHKLWRSREAWSLCPPGRVTSRYVSFCTKRVPTGRMGFSFSAPWSRLPCHVENGPSAQVAGRQSRCDPVVRQHERQ